MIKIKQKQIFDELYGDVTIRHFAHTRAVGYLAAMNITPASASWADNLNVDVVIADHDNWFGKYEFHYPLNGDRIATRNFLAIGEFRHVHLMANQQQINKLTGLLGKKIKIEGDEIALTSPRGHSFFLVDERVPAWLGLPFDHQLVDQTIFAAQLNRMLNRSSCHSIKPALIERAGFFTF